MKTRSNEPSSNGSVSASPWTNVADRACLRASSSIDSLWSRPTTSPGRWRVRKPVPQATSSVRAGGSAAERRPSAVDVLLPARPLALGEAADAAVPLVVLRARAGRSTPSRFLDYARAAAPRVRPELLRGARPDDDRRARGGSAFGRRAAPRRARGRGSQPLGLHVGRLGRRARRVAAGGHRPRGRADRPAPARGGASADRGRRRRPARAAGRRGRGAGARGGRAARGSGGGGARPAGLPLRRARRRARTRLLPAGAGRRSCSVASTRASSRPSTGRHGCRTRPARCSSACAGR